MNWSAPGVREAFFLAWLSLLLTVIAFAVGLSLAFVTSSSATLGFALENAVDFLSSVLVCWRFWGGGTSVPEATLALREKRASVGIAIAFILLAIVVGGVAIGHMASEEAPSHVGALLGLAVPSAMAFGTLGGLKLWVGIMTDSPAMRKDGLCSLCGALLSVGVIAGVIATDSSHGAVWWVDAMVAIVVSVGLLLHGILSAFALSALAFCIHIQTSLSLMPASILSLTVFSLTDRTALIKNWQQGNKWWTAAFWRAPTPRTEVQIPRLQGDPSMPLEVSDHPYFEVRTTTTPQTLKVPVCAWRAAASWGQDRLAAASWYWCL
eukprot:CAMPEP_0115851422 /NCGR_PEP_ID=MMETSP0287-20121206/12475_1 /TAXON_ID=412157 /ORGANISM="Chrysochromulina rotalis, Strain UIO044" /LENGTH=321 /DNA_ID=CAMNT_0003305457 /DNA_START=32 /DNA_END=998 /DNA_ORIENTATION=-